MNARWAGHCLMLRGVSCPVNAETQEPGDLVERTRLYAIRPDAFSHPPFQGGMHLSQRQILHGQPFTFALTTYGGEMTFRPCFAAVLLACISASSFGAVVFDRSPETTNAPILIENFLNVENASLSQWYAERFTLDAASAIDGIDIYSRDYDVDRTDFATTVRIWSSTNDAPAALIYKAATSISLVDKDGASTTENLTRKFAALETAFLAEANTQYWISMTGASGLENIGLASYVNVDDGGMWVGRTGDIPRGFADSVSYTHLA